MPKGDGWVGLLPDVITVIQGKHNERRAVLFLTHKNQPPLAQPVRAAVTGIGWLCPVQPAPALFITVTC